MKKLFIIMLSALSLTAFAQQKKVAVYVTGEDEGVNKVLGSKLVSAITRSDEYLAVERTTAFLAELSKEHNYQRTGAVDEDMISRLGKQFGVQYVCVADVSEALNEQYVSARLINVETAQVDRTASGNSTIRELEDILNVAQIISNDLFSDLKASKAENRKKVAVYIIEYEAGRGIGKVLGDKLVAGFTKSGRYVAIERTNSFLSQLSKEQSYQRTGAVAYNEISRLGKQFGVQYVCVADVSDVLGKKFITARLVDVETAVAINSYEVGGRIDDIKECIRMADEIASNLSKATIERSRSTEGEYKGHLMGDKPHGKGTMIYFASDQYNRKSYEGNWVNGLQSGNGTMIWNDGETYIGEWKNGLRNGYGKNYYANGDIYEGYFENDKRSGRGSMKYADSDEQNRKSYVGNWKNNNRDGNGTQIWNDGDKYTGNWKNDRRHGLGSLFYANNDKYEGTFENDERTGYGTYYWVKLGKRYVGYFKNGMFHGKGTYYWENGREEGTWIEDVQTGSATIYWNDGDIDKGNYVNGKEEGEWIRTSPNGKTKKAKFSDGILVKKWH